MTVITNQQLIKVHSSVHGQFADEMLSLQDITQKSHMTNQKHCQLYFKT